VITFADRSCTEFEANSRDIATSKLDLSGFPPLVVREVSDILQRAVSVDYSSRDVSVHVVHFSGLPYYGSAKSLTAYGMVSEALKRGVLKPGSVVVEPTSGNTGLALAEILRSLGASFIMVVSRKISGAFEAELSRRFAAKTIEISDPSNTEAVLEFIRHHRDEPFTLVVKLPTNYCPTDEPTGAIAYAKKLVDDGGDGLMMLDQYTNNANPEIHREFTAPSILRAVEQRLKGGRRLYVFLSGGTFGTALGLAQFIVEHNLNAKLVVALPRGEDVFGVVDLDNAKRRKFFKELQALAQRSGKPELFEVVEVDSPMEKISRVWDINQKLKTLDNHVDLSGGYSSILVLWCALNYITERGLRSAECVLLFHDSSKMYPTPRPSPITQLKDESIIVDKLEVDRMISEEKARIVYVDPIPAPMPEDAKDKLRSQLEKAFSTRGDALDIKNIQDVLNLDGSLSLEEIRLKPEFVDHLLQSSAKRPIVFVCPHGGTSRLLASKLRGMGVDWVYSLKGGLQTIVQE
jgi:Cysteine synthase